MRWLSLLLAGFPIAIACRLLHAPEWCVFAAAAVALVPMARWISVGAEQVSTRAGRSLGGLVTATFANGSELILSVLALRRGLVDVVKASITGSILANTLLVAGTAAVVGGLRHGRQPFPVKPAGRHAAMMILALSGLCLPAAFARMQANPKAREEVSIGIALLLLLTYLALLYYTHFWRRRQDSDPRGEGGSRRGGAWPLRRAIAVLAAAIVATTACGELLVRSIETFSRSAGFSPYFVGLIVIPLIGNAAEQFTAVEFAIDNRIDLAFSISANSSTQIAVFVAPLLVLISLLFHPMDLILKPIELVALFCSSAIFAYLSLDGETNWFEGFQLVALYLIAAVCFFFLRG